MELLPHPTFDRRLSRAFAAGSATFAVSFGTLLLLGGEGRAGWAKAAAGPTCGASLPAAALFFRDRTRCPRCSAALTRPEFAPAFVCPPCGVEWVTGWRRGG